MGEEEFFADVVMAGCSVQFVRSSSDASAFKARLKCLEKMGRVSCLGEDHNRLNGCMPSNGSDM